MASDNNLKGVTAIENELTERGLSAEGYYREVSKYRRHLSESNEYQEIAKEFYIDKLYDQARIQCQICGREPKKAFNLGSFLGGGILIAMMFFVLWFAFLGRALCENLFYL